MLRNKPTVLDPIQIRIEKIKEIVFNNLCKEKMEEKMEEFYNNWYFYQVYKDKAHYPQAHNIKYE